MTRLIEIIDEKLNDNLSVSEISSVDLPLEVYIINDQADRVKTRIIISTMSSNKDENKIEEEEENKTVLGHISQDEENIFFQPSDNLSIPIFHNDEVITRSVWLKSGDKIQYQKKIISYNVSGDRIKISIIEVSDKPIIITPNNHDSTTSRVQAESLYTASQFEVPTAIENNNLKILKFKKILFLVFFILLISMASFILLAEIVVIDIKPQPDNMSMKGLVPHIKIEKGYLMFRGEYHLIAEKQEFKVLDESINVTDKNNEFFFSMKEKPGFMKFNIDPEKNNKIYIDKELLVNTSSDPHLPEYEIEKGEYILRIINPRYKEYRQSIKIEGRNKQQKYDINLQPNWGIVTIESLTKNAKIEIYSKSNNENVIVESSTNASDKIELISGEYIVKVSKEKYKTKSVIFKIDAQDNLQLEPFELEYKEGLLNLNSEPSGSLIRLNGKYLGQTPQQLKLIPYIEHDIELSLSSYTTIHKKILLEADDIQEKTIKLDIKKGHIFISTSPKQAQLYINGQQQKENSGRFNLTGKNNKIMVKAGSYKTQIKNISASDYSKNIIFILKKNNSKTVIASSAKKKTSIVNMSNQKNSIGQKMIKISPAIFMMGSKKNVSGRSSNEAAHKVQLTYAYLMSDKEVSNKQYRKFKKSHHSGSSGNQSLNQDQQPVVNVSWNDAAKFANWLSIKESLPVYYKEVSGKMMPININAKTQAYRLPFEAEWALAARGTKQKKYPWNGNYPPTHISGNFADASASSNIANTIPGYNDKHAVTAAIGSFAKNEKGFFDLGGNVSEWCQDYYSPSSSMSADKLSINPKGAEKGTHRVVRDSSWRDASIKEVRLSYRSYSKKKSNDIGFRLARYAQ